MTDVLDHLERRAAAEGAKLLFAAEKGSRCFGTEDPSSDHDVHAVVALPLSRYLGIVSPPATYGSETEGDVTSTLFDLRRALAMAATGKSAIRVMARSLRVHVDLHGIGDEMRALSDMSFLAATAMRQYATQMGTAVATMEKRGAAPAKAWLHVLHPLLTFRLVDRTETPPPVAFDDLVSSEEEASLKEAAAMAISLKRAGGGDLPAVQVGVVTAAVDGMRKRSRQLPPYERTSPLEARERADAFIARVLTGGA